MDDLARTKARACVQHGYPTVEGRNAGAARGPREGCAPLAKRNVADHRGAGRDKTFARQRGHLAEDVGHRAVAVQRLLESLLALQRQAKSIQRLQQQMQHGWAGAEGTGSGHAGAGQNSSYRREGTGRKEPGSWCARHACGQGARLLRHRHGSMCAHASPPKPPRPANPRAAAARAGLPRRSRSWRVRRRCRQRRARRAAAARGLPRAAPARTPGGGARGAPFPAREGQQAPRTWPVSRSARPTVGKKRDIARVPDAG
jgi:hypothetical protein